MLKILNKTVNVTVLTVDFKLEFGLLKTSCGRQLFDQIAKTLGIRETWYFGIQCTDKNGDICWLKLDKKISSQLDLKPKDKNVELYFRVKYFPEDVQEELIEDVTKNFFFHQVKSSILDGSIYCPAETAVLLTSYVCQVRLGDYSEQNLSRIPEVTKILPANVLEKHKLTNEEWLQRIHQCYQTHMGMAKEDAMMEYLKICQDLEMYGVNYFPIHNKKGTNLWLGIDSMGLNIYEVDDKLTPKIGFPWGEVKHISYSGKKFQLKPTDKTAKEWHFYVERVRINRQILALSIGNHELYMRRRKPDSTEVQQMKKKAQEQREERSLLTLPIASRIKQRETTRAEIEALRREVEINRQRQEEATKKACQYEEEMEQLSIALKLERESRLELENMQEELRNLNLRLEEQYTSTEEEKQRLIDDRNDLENRVRQQQADLEEQERNKKELNKQLSEAAALAEAQRAAAQNGDSNNNDLNNNDESERDDDAKELHVMENFSRREESRNTEVSRNLKLQKRLATLREDLVLVRDTSKLTPVDKRYESNQRSGMDKFKTLRDIRKGNTKKRIDEFEAM
ncbi:hypothetical protein Ciccas_003639 [Cichlidogyrus casuarinus]|uniref:FERM domain-containing protein n=1 Tax=Cichlidogyrus casuarinus TaxID=1844966 RepID=A0ABD2QDT3_9PLAT